VIPLTDDGGAFATAVTVHASDAGRPAADDPDICTRWAEGEALPEALTVKLNPHMSCMAGTDHPHQPRCVALAGDVGHAVRCTAYASRPSPCHELQPGEDKCQRARARHGLPPLQVPTSGVTLPEPVGGMVIDIAHDALAGLAASTHDAEATDLSLVVATRVMAGAATVGTAGGDPAAGETAAPDAVVIVAVDPVPAERLAGSHAMPALAPAVPQAPDEPAHGDPDVA